MSLNLKQAFFLTSSVFIGVAGGVLLYRENAAPQAQVQPQQLTQQQLAPQVQLAARARPEESSLYDRTVQEHEAANPELNPDSPQYDSDATAVVVQGRDAYIEAGLGRAEALRRAVQEHRTRLAAVERDQRDAVAAQRQAYYTQRDRQQQILAQQRQMHDDLLKSREKQAQVLTLTQGGVSSGHAPPNSAHVAVAAPAVGSNGIVNAATGEFLAPAGPNGFAGTRDGTFYVRSGPNGIVNTRTGQYVPIN